MVWNLIPFLKGAIKKRLFTLVYHSGIQQLTAKFCWIFCQFSLGAREVAHRGADSDAVFGFWGAYEKRFRACKAIKQTIPVFSSEGAARADLSAVYCFGFHAQQSA
jgi:hypothetical protein